MATDKEKGAEGGKAIGKIFMPSPRQAIGALRNMAVPAEAGAGRRLISSLIDQLSPKRYPLEKREEWMNPPKTDVSFREAMKRAGVTEADVAARHRTLAYSVYAMTAIAAAAVTAGIVEAAKGGIYYGAVMAITGLVLPASLIFKFSLASMQIRDRNLNTGWREWLSRRWEWMPPPNSPYVPEKRKKRVRVVEESQD